MRNKKGNRIFLLLILLLGLGIGFAALATTLKINGTTIINKNTWNIYWDNIDNETGVEATTSEIVSEDVNHPNNIVNFAVTLDKPGDYYEFTVDAVNAGTLDAEVLSIEKKYNNTPIPDVEDPENRVVPAYLKYEVKYADDTTPEVGNKLPKATVENNVSTPTRKTYKIRVEYDRDAVTNSDVNNQNGNVSHSFTLSVQYGQATPTPQEINCPGEGCLYAFHTDGWGGSDLFTDDVYLHVGDILPLEIATLGPGTTSNYFAGPTSNYMQLKLEYNTYKENSEYASELFTSMDECLSRNSECEFYQLMSYRPRVFQGFAIDSERVIQKTYLCVDDNNQVYCAKYWDTDGEASGDDNKANALEFFGEWDSTTETGCHEVDGGNWYDYLCVSHDKKITMTFNGNSTNIDYQENNLIKLTGFYDEVGGPDISVSFD